MPDPHAKIWRLHWRYPSGRTGRDVRLTVRDIAHREKLRANSAYPDVEHWIRPDERAK